MKEINKLCVVDKQHNKIDINENWAYGVRIIERCDKDNKKVEMFITIKTSVIFFRLKQKVRKLCRDENLWMTQNN